MIQKVIRLRHELYQYPELSMHEKGTKQWLMDFFRINTSLKITDCGSWFYAEYLSDNKEADTCSAQECVDDVRRAAGQCGMQLIELEEPFKVSEDFGYYTKECPGAMFYIGNGEDYPNIHTEKYDFRDCLIEKVIRLYGIIYVIQLLSEMCDGFLVHFHCTTNR